MAYKLILQYLKHFKEVFEAARAKILNSVLLEIFFEQVFHDFILLIKEHLDDLLSILGLAQVSKVETAEIACNFNHAAKIMIIIGRFTF